MYTTITEQDFINAFQAIRPDNFSVEGLRALFDYFEQLEEETGEEIELDVIAICCDYTEETVQDVADNYNLDTSNCDDHDELENFVLCHLQDNTHVVAWVPQQNTVIYQQF